MYIVVKKTHHFGRQRFGVIEYIERKFFPFIQGRVILRAIVLPVIDARNIPGAERLPLITMTEGFARAQRFQIACQQAVVGTQILPLLRVGRLEAGRGFQCLDARGAPAVIQLHMLAQQGALLVQRGGICFPRLGKLLTDLEILLIAKFQFAERY
ncbi:hypothetical protein D3C81_1590130 [compost metagenome]